MSCFQVPRIKVSMCKAVLRCLAVAGFGSPPVLNSLFVAGVGAWVGEGGGQF